MKLGLTPQEHWFKTNRLASKFNPLNTQLQRLMILDHVWNKIVSAKGRFWVLKALQNHTVYVQVKISVARSELIVQRQRLIRELNKHFDKPWIEKIEIQ